MGHLRGCRGVRAQPQRSRRLQRNQGAAQAAQTFIFSWKGVKGNAVSSNRGQALSDLGFFLFFFCNTRLNGMLLREKRRCPQDNHTQVGGGTMGPRRRARGPLSASPPASVPSHREGQGRAPQEGPGLWRGLTRLDPRTRGHRSHPGPRCWGSDSWPCSQPQVTFSCPGATLPPLSRGSLGGAAPALPRGLLGFLWDPDPASPGLGNDVRRKLSCWMISPVWIGFSQVACAALGRYRVDARVGRSGGR